MSRSGSGGRRRIERRTVSRKTAGDGKLEITKIAAGKLEALGTRFPVAVSDRQGHAHLGTMPCTCRGGDTPHVHYFVESDLFRALAAGTDVELLLDEDASRLIVLPA